MWSNHFQPSFFVASSPRHWKVTLFFLAVLDGLEAAALGNTVSQQILPIFLEPKKSKHYSQENEIALDTYNIIIAHRKRDRQQLMHTSSYRLHVDYNQTPKRPKVHFHLQCFGISGYHGLVTTRLEHNTQVASEIAKHWEEEGQTQTGKETQKLGKI